MEKKFYKTAILMLFISGITLMGISAPSKGKYISMRSETYRECRSLTGVSSQKEVKKVQRSDEYKKFQKLIRTRHW